MSQDNPPIVLDIDDEQDGAPSEVGSSGASSTTSLRNSLMDYRIENGRTYHRYKDGKYAFPNDDRELDRLDLQHQQWLLLLDDRLGVAPPCKEGAQVGRVLDVGTGTGIWALNFGDEHPEAEVYGVDLSPTLPGYVPPNVKFEIDDVEEEWTWTQPFDYINSRAMTASINNWEAYLRQCYDNLAPGGWVELQEFDIFLKSDDGTLAEDNILLKWVKLLKSAAETLGRTYVSPPSLKSLLSEIGFVDVSLSLYKCPLNTWPKDQKYKQLGAVACENMLAGIEGFTMASLTRAFDWTPEEVNVLLIDVRNEVKNRNTHSYTPWCVSIHPLPPFPELCCIDMYSRYCIIGKKPEKEPTLAPPAPPSAEAASFTPA
ncbi:methyltransferase domain-containing protein [Colletotrichum navitas]|uniref:Methyltransferase domain-containing protein n=1 Tax=Colletotrichum navitas TaxID=681940 RepID=A0AAD8QCY8_9PEZI|nr:methyltransferase domain-containing protein [Colletotrichum navitas]KAK1600367.1 methyltransferase domain-containing protein [Colletotrichum navitas]